MPFTKETAKIIGRSGGLQRAENERRKTEWLFGQGRTDFQEFAKKQAILQSGGELSKSELLWMQNVKDLLEFHLPKRARVNETGETVQPAINIVAYSDKK
jgi:hypothetical protein